MKIKNYEVEPLARLLYRLTLKGKDSRMRTRLVNLLEEHLKSIIIVEEQSLIEQYAKRDENDQLILDGDNQNIFKLEEETAQEYHSERDALLNEYFHIEETESNKIVILTVAEIMLDGDFEVSGEDAVLYDKWCEQFEETISDYGGGA